MLLWKPWGYIQKPRTFKCLEGILISIHFFVLVFLIILKFLNFLLLCYNICITATIKCHKICCCYFMAQVQNYFHLTNEHEILTPDFFFPPKTVIMNFLLSSILYIKRIYQNRKNFQLSIFNGFTVLGCSEHNFIIFTKCVSVWKILWLN